MIKYYFIGAIILISAILANIIAAKIGLKTWYDFLNTINNERLRHYQSVIEGFMGMNNPIEADNTLAILERVRNAPVGSLAIEDFKKWVQQGIGQINNLQTKINDLNIGLEHLPTDKIKLLFEHLNEIKPIEHLRKLFQVAND